MERELHVSLEIQMRLRIKNQNSLYTIPLVIEPSTCLHGNLLPFLLSVLTIFYLLLTSFAS